MTIARYVAGMLRAAADRLEPPAELIARGKVERTAARAHHPSVTDDYDLPGMPQALAPVIDLRQPCKWRADRCETPSALCMLDCEPQRGDDQ